MQHVMFNMFIDFS